MLLVNRWLQRYFWGHGAEERKLQCGIMPVDLCPATQLAAYVYMSLPRMRSPHDTRRQWRYVTTVQVYRTVRVGEYDGGI